MSKAKHSRRAVKKFTEEIYTSKKDPHSFKIEFRGTEDVVIEGCLGVISYSDSCISLNLGRRTVTFCGAELSIESFSDGFITLTGTVVTTEFST